MDEDQDLWEKIKAAKNHLFTQTGFLQKYRTGPSLTGNSPSNHNRPLDSLPTTSTSSTTQKEEKEGNNSITVGESESSKNSREPSNGYPSSSVVQSESLTSLSTIVPIALPPGENRLPSRLLPQSESQKSILSTTSTLPSKKEQPVASNGNNLTHTLSSPLRLTGPENTETALVKMSDASDEVMLRNGRFGGHANGRFGAGPRPRQVLEQNIAQHESRRLSNPIQNGRSDSRTNISVKREPAPQSREVNTRHPSADEGPSQNKPHSDVLKDLQKSAPQETLEELKRLQQKIVAKAHQNRFKDLDTPSTNPETLIKVREGPGTDPKSKVYQEFSKWRAVPGKSHRNSSVQSPVGALGPKIETGLKRYQAQWTAYAETEAVYPVVDDGRLVLLSEPTDSALILKASSQEVGLQMDLDAADLSTAVQPAEHNWGDAFYADWEYRPRACSNFEAFRDWFRRWLDTTLSICCYVDIYHPAFFDGTAHPDGEESLLIPDFDDHSTSLDWNDEESRLHCHETVEGYCYNWALHLKREEEEEQERRVRARNAYIESTNTTTPLVSPQTPKANLYLRPVEMSDIPELLDFFNWYIHKSTLTVDVAALNEDEVRERIETAKRERLPFIVAAERRSIHNRDNSSQKILGYALATNTIGNRTAERFTADLEIFVRPEFKRRGIGKCLMDKLLEVCDPTYNPLGGYFFDAGFEDRTGYYSGGRRRLVRLMFVISYPYEDRKQYKWIHEWLEKNYDFEQQGLLRGTRIKFNRL